MKALLIDDDQLALHHLEKMLREFGSFELIDTFADPLEALEASLRTKPNVVFLDIMLPNLHGIKTAEYLQSHLPQAQIVFVSSHVKYAVKAFEINALDFISKPFQRQRLLQTIRKLQICSDFV